MDPTTPGVLNVLVLDNEGKRLAVKYYGSEWCVSLRGSGFPWLLFSAPPRVLPRGW